MEKDNGKKLNMVERLLKELKVNEDFYYEILKEEYLLAKVVGEEFENFIPVLINNGKDTVYWLPSTVVYQIK